jgi:protein-tyrosine phosphatase
LEDKIKRICFVCSGNIVRSPLAEHMFIRWLRQAGLEDKYKITSCATGPWHVGEEPDARMRRVAARKGLHYTGSAKQFQQKDFQKYDLILAMDTENLSFLRSLAGSEDEKDKVRLFREFDPLAGPGAIVPDPYYGGIDGFEEVYEIVERSTRALLKTLESGESEES